MVHKSNLVFLLDLETWISRNDILCVQTRTWLNLFQTGSVLLEMELKVWIVKICLHEQSMVIHTCFTLILNMAAAANDDDGGSPQLGYRKFHLEQMRNRFPSSGPSPPRDTFVGQHWAHLEPPLGLSYAPQIGSLLTMQKSETAGQSV